MLLRRTMENRWADDPFVAEMLRRGLRRQLGDFTENLPSGESVNQAVVRVAPRVGSPLARIADIPVTDTLPAPVDGFSNSNAGYENATRPVLNRPLTRPGRALSDIPEETRSVVNTEIPQRPLLKSAAIEPEVMPRDFQPSPLERRLSSIIEPGTTVLNEPAPPMVELGQRPIRRNTGDLERDEMDYYNQLYRYKPVNHNSRAAGFGLGAWRGLQRGGIVGSLVGALRGLIDKSADEKDAREENLARSSHVIGEGLQRRKVLSDLESDRTLNAIRNDTLQRAPLDRQIKADELERDNLRGIYTNLDDFDPVKNPQHATIAGRAAALGMVLPAKAKGEKSKPRWKVEGAWWTLDDDGRPTPLLNPQTGEQMVDRGEAVVPYRTAGGRDVFVPQTTVASADATAASQSATQNRWEYEQGQQEGNRYEKEKSEYDAAVQFNAEVDRQIAEKRREQAENERVANDPNFPYQERDAARARANSVRDQIGQLEASKKRVSQPRPPRVPATRAASPTVSRGSSRSLPKLTERQIRAAAIENHLDPDKAVAKARARGQL